MLRIFSGLTLAGGLYGLTTGWFAVGIGVLFLASTIGGWIAPHPFLVGLVGVSGLALGWIAPVVAMMNSFGESKAAHKEHKITFPAVLWGIGTALVVTFMLTFVVSIVFSLFAGKACEFNNPMFEIAIFYQPAMLLLRVVLPLFNPALNAEADEFYAHIGSCVF